jgi:hypothetical protein
VKQLQAGEMESRMSPDEARPVSFAQIQVIANIAAFHFGYI